MFVLHFPGPVAHAEAQMQQSGHFVEQLIDRMHQAGIVRRLRNCHMEFLVGFQKARDAFGFIGLVAGTADFVEQAQAFGIHLAGGESRGRRFQQQPQFENVLDVFQRDRGDHVAAARDRAHQTVMGQTRQRHAHRRLAQFVLGAQPGFGDFASRREQAADDVVFHAFIRALTEQGDGFDGSGHFVKS